MKKSLSLEATLLLLLAGIIIVLFVLSQWVLTPRPHDIAAIQDNSFSKEQMVFIQKDTLTSALKRIYGDNVSIEDGNKYRITVQNMGTKISNFYNDNPELLKVDNYGFEIERQANNTIKATFDPHSINSKTYIRIPSDVVYGIFNN